MRYLIPIIVLFAFQNLYSQVGGETLYSFLNLPTSPKQIALGGITLTSNNDVSQVLWNPAAVNQKVEGDVSVNFVNYIANINVGSFSYAKSINPKYGTAFLGIQYFNYGDFERTDASGPQVLGVFTARDLAFSLGYGYTYKEFTFGASLKYISSKIDVFTSSALLYDLGFTYKHLTEPFLISAVLRNSGNQLTQYLGSVEQLNNNFIVSAEYKLEYVPLKFYASIDELNNWDISEPDPSKSMIDLESGAVTQKEISKFANSLRHLSLGAELWPDKNLNLRIGYNHRKSQEYQLDEVRTASGISYGFGFNTKYIKFDYAFAKFQEGAKYSTFGLTLHTIFENKNIKEKSTTTTGLFRSAKKTKKKTLVIPIKVINIGAKNVIIHPKKVRISFQVKRSQFDEVNEDDFVIVCDYAKRRQGYMNLVLTKNLKGVSSIKLKGNKVKYLILE